MRKNKYYQKSKKANPKLAELSTNQQVIDKMKPIRNTIYSAATFSINFVWLYLLKLYEKELSDGRKTLIDIYNIIDGMTNDLREKTSIMQVYEYLYDSDGKWIKGKLTVDEVKKLAPAYELYIIDMTSYKETMDQNPT